MTTANVAKWNLVAASVEKKVYRLWIVRQYHYIFGIWTPDVTRVLDFICEHENEIIYLEIL